MLVTLDELKENLRIETDDDDELLITILNASIRLVKDVMRDEHLKGKKRKEIARMGVLYAGAYMYEHREEADHKKMLLTLRSLLFGERISEF